MENLKIMAIMLGFGFIYIFMSSSISGLHDIKYGKRTILAWIPLTQAYMLGKVVYNKLTGWLLTIAVLLTGKVEVKVGFYTTQKTIIPESIYKPYFIIVAIVLCLCILYTIFKNIKYKFDLKSTNKNDKEQAKLQADYQKFMENQQQPIMNQNVQQVPVQPGMPPQPMVNPTMQQGPVQPEMPPQPMMDQQMMTNSQMPQNVVNQNIN